MGVLQIQIELRVFLGVVFAFATDYVLSCLYAGPTYSVVFTIVHSDGTSTLSPHTMSITVFLFLRLCWIWCECKILRDYALLA
jgi:hypothetical protein